jgi:hypothetical protein
MASFITHFFILTPTDTVIPTNSVPPFGCAFLYHMLKAQLFLFYASAHTSHLTQSISAVNQFFTKNIHLTQNAQLGNYGWHGNQGVTLTHTHTLNQLQNVYNYTKSNVTLERTAVTIYLHYLL